MEMIKNKNVKQTLVISIVTMFLLTSFVGFTAVGESLKTTGEGKTHDVYPGEGTPIQDAIDSASEKDTIFIHKGTYYERIIINKNSLKVIGEDMYNTVIDGENGGDVVRIKGGYIEFSGFHIINGDDGIHMEYDRTKNLWASFCNINNNLIEFCDVGINVAQSIECVIAHNDISSGNCYGIHMDFSRECKIIRNTISNRQSCYAVYVHESYNNMFVGNHIYGNSGGITFDSPHCEPEPDLTTTENKLYFNHIHDNDRFGIGFESYSLEDANNHEDISGNIATYNNLFDNGEYGKIKNAKDRHYNNWISNYYGDWDGEGSYLIKGATNRIDISPLSTQFDWQNPLPAVPTIEGERKITYDSRSYYRFSTESPAPGAEVYYVIDWGDGTEIEEHGPFPFEDSLRTYHRFQMRGTYDIKCKARYQYFDAETDWETFEVSTFKAKSKSIGLNLELLLGNFPQLQRLLQRFQ